MTAPVAPLMSVEDVAERLNVPVRTVQALAAQQKIRAAKCGRQWRFRPVDVEAYISRIFGEPEPIRQVTTPPVQAKRRNDDGYVSMFGLPPLSQEQIRGSR